MSVRLYLASTSPRRRELLALLGVAFEVLTPTGEWTDETPLPGETPAACARRLAEAKARAGWQAATRLVPSMAPGQNATALSSETLSPSNAPPAPASHEPSHQQRSSSHETPLVLAADTVVACDGAILGKPARPEEARAMLRRLSGRRHEVITAVTLFDGTRLEGVVVTSHVEFAALPEAWIGAYVASGEPMDKAGAYALQGAAAAFIREVRGSPSGVVGLPLHETAVLLAQWGLGPMADATTTQPFFAPSAAIVTKPIAQPAVVAPCVRELFLNCTPQETRLAVVENGVLQEVHVERASRRGLVGNIYRGQVVRVLPGMQSAFVDIGLARTAFLHASDLISPGRIETQLREGEALTVQILKDPVGSKGSRLTQQVSLAGRFLVYLPHDTSGHIGVSQRIDSEAEREALRARVAALVPRELTGGFIVRTNALEADDAALSGDIAYLVKLWRDIRRRAGEVKPPALLYAELDLALRTVRDHVDAQTTRVAVDSRENAERMILFARDYAPHVLPLIELYRGERPLFATYQIEDEIARALARRVELRSGGYLVFDQTEALTIIDVNTGGFVGTRNFEETILKTNLEAAQTIARQLRLRNIGGIVVIDFIDMVQPEHRERVLTTLKEALARDPVRTCVNGFTQLGLVELTRKRGREALQQLLCQTCPTCQGSGRVKTPETVALEILREIVRETRQYPHVREFRVLAAPAVVDWFHEEPSQALAMVSHFVGKPISLHGESSYGPEQYDIVWL